MDELEALLEEHSQPEWWEIRVNGHVSVVDARTEPAVTSAAEAFDAAMTLLRVLSEAGYVLVNFADVSAHCESHAPGEWRGKIRVCVRREGTLNETHERLDLG